MLLFFTCLKKSNQNKRHPDVRRGIVSLASLGEGKLADKQQSAQTSPHLNRSRSWTLHPAPIGEKGTVLSISFVSFGFDFRCIVMEIHNRHKLANPVKTNGMWRSYRRGDYLPPSELLRLSHVLHFILHHKWLNTL